MPSQNRLALTRALADHDQRDASTLVAEQLSAPITASAAWPEGRDTAMVDATAAEVTVTLPLGTDENIGLHHNIVKTDAAANDAIMATPAGQTFEDNSTTIAVAGQHGRASAYWDGTVWRRAEVSASGGPIDGTDGTFDSVTAAAVTVTTGNLVVTLGDITLPAGDVTLTEGRLTITAGLVTITGLAEYADDAAAKLGGLTEGMAYRTAAGAVMVVLPA